MTQPKDLITDEQADTFQDFFEQELAPLIKARYPELTDAELFLFFSKPTEVDGEELITLATFTQHLSGNRVNIYNTTLSVYTYARQRLEEIYSQVSTERLSQPTREVH